MKEKYYRDYWNSKDLKIGMAFNNKLVAIGEEFGYGGFKFIHFRTRDFIEFAKGVINENMGDNNLQIQMSKKDLEFMLGEFEVPPQLINMLENPPDGVSIAESVLRRLNVYNNLKKQYDNIYKS